MTTKPTPETDPAKLCNDRLVTKINAQLKQFEALQRSVELDVRRTKDALHQKETRLAALTGAIEATQTILQTASECDCEGKEKPCPPTD